MATQKILLSLVIQLCGTVALAQDSTKNGKLTLSGSVDGYYRYNFHNAKDSGHTNNLTSFTNSQNSFELGMASLKADYTMGKVEAVADLGFGRRAEEFSYNDKAAMTAIKQAFISYSPSSKVKFTMGKWFTHVGYEMPDAYLNHNYSMAYLFSYGPFFHTGIKMEVTANNNIGFMIGVANPTDYSTASFAAKNFIAQLHLADNKSKLSAYVNYIGGKDMNGATVNQFDLTATAIISGKFNIGYNGSVKTVKPKNGRSGNWAGTALYLNYEPSSIVGLTARGEYFSDKKGLAGFGTNVYEFTLSGNIHLGNLTIIPEFRTDGAGNPLFYKNTDQMVSTAKSTGTFILAAVLHF